MIPLFCYVYFTLLCKMLCFTGWLFREIVFNKLYSVICLFGLFYSNIFTRRCGICFSKSVLKQAQLFTLPQKTIRIMDTGNT